MVAAVVVDAAGAARRWIRLASGPRPHYHQSLLLPSTEESCDMTKSSPSRKPAAKPQTGKPPPSRDDMVEDELDEALRETFPASDPIAVDPNPRSAPDGDPARR
ncbi:hypothetical protein SAMN05216345_110122 [Cupriavidus sp. YR651]|nr:hypothetical protein SAMN05216345_110122 [Cupriavidus sp. YR651]